MPFFWTSRFNCVPLLYFLALLRTGVGLARYVVSNVFVSVDDGSLLTAAWAGEVSIHGFLLIAQRNISL